MPDYYSSDMIATDLSEITQSVKPGLGETKADSTAMHFAKHLAMRKLETVLLAVGRRVYVEAWRRWQAMVRFVKTEDSVLVFVAYMGAHRFKRACMSIITGNKQRVSINVTIAFAWDRYLPFTTIATLILPLPYPP